MKLFLAPLGFAVLSMFPLGIMATKAEPAKGVTPNVIGRATFDAFNLQSDPRALEFAAQAKGPVDIVVRTHDYAPGSSTGWHSHPGRSSSRSLRAK
jgi:quercetin dioxygenase-like cupin family protein